MQNSPRNRAGAATGAATTEADSGRRRRRRAAAVAACVAVLGLFGAGCSDSSDGKSATDSGASDSAKADADEVAYRKCLRDNGLDIPDPKPGEDSEAFTVDGDMETTDKAFKACKDKAPGGGTGDGEGSQADKDEQLKFVKCMRKKGVDLPDPEPNDEGGVEALPEPTGAAEKKKFDKAFKACAGDVQ